MALDYRAKGADFGLWLEQNAGKIGYLIGTRGQTCTAALITKNRAIFTSYVTNIDKYAAQWIGKVVCDCMGTYECFLSGGAYNKPLTSWKYSDINTGYVYSLAKSEGLKNGLIATLPKTCPYPIAVGYDGHVGFFYKGKVYQSSGHAYGLEITELSSTAHNHAWQYWYYLPWLDYSISVSTNESEEIMINIGDKGQPVYELQTAYQKLGYDLGTFANMKNPTVKDGRDGSYGSTCVGITKQIQTKNGIPVTGVVDAATYGKIALNLMEYYVNFYQTKLDAVGATQSTLDATNAKVNELTVLLSAANKKIAAVKTAIL